MSEANCHLLCAGTEITGVCRNRGAVGGLQALTALESHFARVSLQALPAQGGFHAAYSGTQQQGISSLTNAVLEYPEILYNALSYNHELMAALICCMHCVPMQNSSQLM